MATLFSYCAEGFGTEIMSVTLRLNALKPGSTVIYFVKEDCETATRYDARVFKFDAVFDVY